MANFICLKLLSDLQKLLIIRLVTAGNLLHAVVRLSENCTLNRHIFVRHYIVDGYLLILRMGDGARKVVVVKSNVVLHLGKFWI